MIDPHEFVDHLGSKGVSFYAGVPDSLLKEFGTHVMAELPRSSHVIAANEGAAVSIALGHHLATGATPLVYLQNSGFGNLVNPVLSLADRDVYGIPMVILIGWRGEPGVKDEPQHVTQGRVMADLLDGLDMPWVHLPSEPALVLEAMSVAVDTAVEQRTPYFVLVSKGTFSSSDASPGAGHASPGLPSREEALIRTVEAIPDEALIVSTTGMLSRELFEYRERTGTDAARDFLTVGGMGHASSIALGLALEQRDREVWCLDGDGALLMHLGSLAVIADHAPTNYHHVVFNNGVHDSVGGQPTSIGKVDIPAAATALGYRTADGTSDLSAVSGLLQQHRSVGGPTLLELQVRPGNRDGIGRPTRTPAQARAAFMEALA